MYVGLCKLNQQMILAARPLDVNPIAVLLLQPLFLLLSPVGDSSAVHLNQSSFPLLSICDSTAASSPSPGHSSLGPRRRPPALVRSARCGHHGQQPRVIGRGLYVESLTGGTHEVHGRTEGKFLLIKLKKNVPPPDSWDPPAVSSHGRKCLLVMRKNYSSR